MQGTASTALQLLSLVLCETHCKLHYETQTALCECVSAGHCSNSIASTHSDDCQNCLRLHCDHHQQCVSVWVQGTAATALQLLTLVLVRHTVSCTMRLNQHSVSVWVQGTAATALQVLILMTVRIVFAYTVTIISV